MKQQLPSVRPSVRPSVHWSVAFTHLTGEPSGVLSASTGWFSFRLSSLAYLSLILCSSPLSKPLLSFHVQLTSNSDISTLLVS